MSREMFKVYLTDLGVGVPKYQRRGEMRDIRRDRELEEDVDSGSGVSRFWRGEGQKSSSSSSDLTEEISCREKRQNV